MKFTIMEWRKISISIDHYIEYLTEELERDDRAGGKYYIKSTIEELKKVNDKIRNANVG